MHQRERRISFNRKQEEYFGHLIANTEKGKAAAWLQDITGSEEELKVRLQTRKTCHVDLLSPNNHVFSLSLVALFIVPETVKYSWCLA